MSTPLNRRDILKNTTLAGAGFFLAGNLRSRAEENKSASPSEKLNVALVGCGGRAEGNLAGVAGENIVALCDVDAARAAGAFKQYPNAKKFRDYRNMLDAMHKEIDAVVVSTPDHTHAVAALAAMNLGKHCYCEKPLAHSVHQARRMAEVAKEKKLATQMGTQIHEGDNYRRVVELVQGGAIGPVGEVHVWSAAKYHGGELPKEYPPTPEGLDWDRWLGPAPYHPYSLKFAPFWWRNWWDFGTGTLGDFGCHYGDLAFWALGLRHPTTVEAEGPPVDPASTPEWLIVRYTYPARGDMPPASLTWYDSGKKPPFLAEKKIPEWDSGVLFIGAKGMLLADYGRRMLLPEPQYTDFKAPEPTIPASIGHHKEWIVACKTGSPTTCNFDYSGALTEAVLLGAVAYKLGKKLDWDGAALKATNCPEADALVHGTYREGWSL
ncbi:MAG: Gfo/Idh/MocA family oxidoreductase [Planctomycetia bacterium]|nr:Gfo/Idh/MocA family oxidoreductase [Planctomycetia bacterium]